MNKIYTSTATEQAVRNVWCAEMYDFFLVAFRHFTKLVLIDILTSRNKKSTVLKYWQVLLLIILSNTEGDERKNFFRSLWKIFNF